MGALGALLGPLWGPMGLYNMGPAALWDSTLLSLRLFCCAVALHKVSAFYTDSSLPGNAPSVSGAVVEFQ